MKKIALFILVLTGHLLHSQEWTFEKPNYKKIEKNIKKKDSNLNYESLMARYLEADSTMTLEEKRHLYYGYSFDKNYSPYSRSDFKDSLRVVLRKEQLDSVDLNKLVYFTDKMLFESPFDLDAINYQLYALEQIGNKQSFDNRMTQLRTIVDAMLSSGNGKQKNEAFFVIYTSHEYNLLSILGFQFGGSQSLIEHYDYLTLAENEAKLEGLYFDVSPCLNAMTKMFKE